MNKKAWWQNIQSNYPLTLADCKAFFERRFRDDYRTKMQDYKELLPYFQEKYIQIDLRPSYRSDQFPKYGYKLYSNWLTIQRSTIYESQEAAAFDALEFAFRCREQYLEKRGQKSAFKFKSRWHKEARKEEEDKPTLGERVEQQNKKSGAT